MENDDLNEYNSIGAPSEEVKRKLRYLAEIGSEAVTSAFRVSSGYEGRTHQEKRDTADAQFQALAEMVMASQEHMAAFQAKLVLYDEASTAALLENEEQMREAELTLERIRMRAHVVSLPDGQTARVYRDGKAVRDEAGGVIDFLTPEDLPVTTPELSEIKAVFGQIDELTNERNAILSFQDKRASAAERIKDGALSERDLSELNAALEEAPASVKRHFNRISAERGSPQVTSIEMKEPAAEKTLSTSIEPTKAFTTASSAISLDDFAALPDAEPVANREPNGPGVSTPAPG